MSVTITCTECSVLLGASSRTVRYLKVTTRIRKFQIFYCYRSRRIHPSRTSFFSYFLPCFTFVRSDLISQTFRVLNVPNQYIKGKVPCVRALCTSPQPTWSLVRTTKKIQLVLPLVYYFQLISSKISIISKDSKFSFLINNFLRVIVVHYYGREQSSIGVIV